MNLVMMKKSKNRKSDIVSLSVQNTVYKALIALDECFSCADTIRQDKSVEIEWHTVYDFNQTMKHCGLLEVYRDSFGETGLSILSGKGMTLRQVRHYLSFNFNSGYEVLLYKDTTNKNPQYWVLSIMDNFNDTYNPDTCDDTWTMYDTQYSKDDDEDKKVRKDYFIRYYKGDVNVAID